MGAREAASALGSPYTVEATAERAADAALVGAGGAVFEGGHWLDAAHYTSGRASSGAKEIQIGPRGQSFHKFTERPDDEVPSCRPGATLAATVHGRQR
jgi:hypothetical protein